MDVAFAWDEAGKIDPAVYTKMGEAGITTALAFGARVPAKWTKDGTVFAGVKAEEWDGL